MRRPATPTTRGRSYQALAGAPAQWPTKRATGWECWKAAAAITRRRHRRLAELVERVGDKGADPALIERAATARGWALYKLPALDEAESCLAAAVERDAANEEAQYCLGLARAGAEHWIEAIGPLELVEQQAADAARATQARAALAICYGRAGRLGDAKTAYQRVRWPVRRRPNWPTRPPTGWPKPCCRKIRPGRAACSSRSPKRDRLADYAARALAGLAWSQLQTSDAVGFGGNVRPAVENLSRRPPRSRSWRWCVGRHSKCSTRPIRRWQCMSWSWRSMPGASNIPTRLWKAARLSQRLSRMSEAEGHYRRLAGVEPAFGQMDSLLYQWSRHVGRARAWRRSGRSARAIAARLPREPLGAGRQLSVGRTRLCRQGLRFGPVVGPRNHGDSIRRPKFCPRRFILKGAWRWRARSGPKSPGRLRGW